MFSKVLMGQIIQRVLLCIMLISAPLLALGESDDHVQVSLISSVTRAESGKSFDVLFRQQIDAGWHTYWISPGDSGAPPSISWELPEGVSVSELRYPWPERIAYGPLMNYGYHDEVLMPFTITIDQSFNADILTLEGRGRILVCEEICIPQAMRLELSVPVGPEVINASASNLFSQAMSRLPVPLEVDARFESLVEENAESMPGRIRLTLAIPIAQNMQGETRLSSVEYFPYQLDVIDNPAEQEFEVTEEGLVLTLVPGYDFDALTADLSGVLVLHEEVGGGVTSAFEITTGGASPMVGSSAGQAPGLAAAGKLEMGLLTAVLFAFLGGLILNLMPCVFPVLSIKILSLVDSVHERGESIRLHGMAYTLGVVGSFVAIAAALILLRATGEVIGWGFQLQSPIVVALLAYLFVLIGLNLLGSFEVGLSLMSLGGGPTKPGNASSDGDRSGDTKGKGYLGSAATGVLATIVAAPCTAPFMGAAVGYALLQSPITGLIVFAALGAGMALPYLLLCYSPALLSRLPRPGNWMVVLRQFLAFPMFASAIWLVWVLGVQAGPTSMMQVLGGALLISFAVWLLGTKSRNPSLTVGLRFFAAAMLVIAVYIAAVQKTAPLADAATQRDLIAGEPLVYSTQALADARTRGPVFVNFTAAWCITCKVNELNALNVASVTAAFEAGDVTYLRADWTNEDPLITEALQEFGRSGVPLYLLYPKGQGEPRVLPQLLTESIVLRALGDLH